MAEGPSATSEKIARHRVVVKQSWYLDVQAAMKFSHIREFFSCPLWYYAVHTFIGDIVQS